MNTTGTDISLTAVVRDVLMRAGTTEWTLEPGPFWCSVTGPDPVERVQGWKLHVSATPLSAPQVLHRAAETLVALGCPFKFAGDMARVHELVNVGFDRAQAGKFLTAYPRDDDHFRELADAVHLATLGLPGPQILSDRPYRPGSLVHFRYGAFTGIPVFTNDGAHQTRIAGPGSRPERDRRDPWFTPPTWAELPFPADPARRAATGPVVLDGRFAVERAIRHTARGGVYRATDRRTGDPVIVKQARPHIGSGLAGTDCRDVLRAEAARLGELADAVPAVVPALLGLVDHDGHLFLVESAVPGASLAETVRERFDGLRPAPGPDEAEAVGLAGRLARLLGVVHRRGLVVRDLSPANVMVTPDGSLRLIDLEVMTRPETFTFRGFTPGYAAPEVLAAPPHGPAPDLTADLYSLGMVLFHLVTGATAILADDDAGSGRTVRDRLVALLDACATPAARRLAPVVLGLTADDPAQRWSLDRVTAFLRTPAPGRRDCTSYPRLSDADGDRLITDGIDHVLATMDLDGDWVWPQPEGLRTADPCAVMFGAAGVLSVLVRADRVLHRPDLHAAVASVAGWIDERRKDIPVLLPGLYFGRSGTAWALHDAARHLDDPLLARHAVELGLDVPVRWPNPDVCHGAAGAGLAQLHLWQATGDDAFERRVRECADGLLDAASYLDDGVYWPVPADFDSTLAGIHYLGFAHGVAGVGAFLLAAGRATGNADYLEAARRAGDTLVATADRGSGPEEGGAARWRADRSAATGLGLLYHWCSGSSGVGTFLLRLAAHAGPDGERYRVLAAEAAVAVRAARWSSSTASCHGLSGNGEFLLDLAEQVPDGVPFRAWAAEIGAGLAVRDVRRGGRRLVVDETLADVVVNHATGLAGVLGFLLRLRHGGPRPWMADGVDR